MRSTIAARETRRHSKIPTLPKREDGPAPEIKELACYLYREHGDQIDA